MDKQRAELLASFDTISSHMDTTFSALSTALSRCSNNKDSTNARVYLAILVGPSLESAKSKVILGIDGLEKRIWGNHINVSNTQEAEDDEEPETEVDDAEYPDDSQSDESEDEESEDESEDGYENVATVSSLPSPGQLSHESEQRFLQNAERLLSRTLAVADGDGKGIISEMCTFSRSV